MASPIIKAHQIVKDFATDGSKLRVLHGVSVSLQKGEILGIIGQSGAGKSTLLHIMGLLDEPTEGWVELHGVKVSKASPTARARLRNDRLAFVFQFYHLLGDLTALENVILPRMVRYGMLRYLFEKSRLKKRAAALLDRVGLAERMSHRPGQLSGGERQRVAIARALMNDPEVLLCDEPTGNLDSKTGESILELLWELREENDRTLLIVTHNAAVAERADRCIRMGDGVITGKAQPPISSAAA